MESVWQKEVSLPRFPKLRGDIRTEVLIIGGGMAGLLCAHFLQRAGVRCVIAEAQRVCGGTTGRTTAKITVQHGFFGDKLQKQFGLHGLRQYLQANQAALDAYRKLCAEIDCDYVEQDAFAYSLGNPALLEREIAALSRAGSDAFLCQTPELPFPTAGAVCFPRQGAFHPLKFAQALCRDLTIYEDTRVTELAPGVAVTDGGTIHAEKILVATHFPFLNKHGSYFLKLYQQRSYVLALEGETSLTGMYIDGTGNGLSFRSRAGQLLLGGGGHRTGKSGGGWAVLEDFARSHYPQLSITARWATQDCMSLDGVPYIGPYSRRTRDLYVATGFNKWGMTGSMVAAQLLTDRILGRENPAAALFSPSRTMLRPQLAQNGFEAVLHLLTPTRPRCPHLGCALKWNPAEHSWDCPCHGSRFGEDGTLLNNPANGPLPSATESQK